MPSPPSREEFQEAGFDLIADFEKVDPESYLLHCMEIQRRKRFDGRHVVGGHAILTTITAGGVTHGLRINPARRFSRRRWIGPPDRGQPNAASTAEADRSADLGDNS
ncbi:hypothetical protein ACVWXO_008623 [Bradyrhizobium sp. LM2.7]